MTSHIAQPASQPEFDHYMSVDLINAVENEARWTVSSNQKVPMDMVRAMRPGESHVSGAKSTDETSLVSRTKLIDFFTNRPFTNGLGMIPMNHTLYLDITKNDPFLVLDIEPSCPKGVLNTMLEQLPWVYAERSSSGRGVHLVVPTPWPTPNHPGYLKILHDAGEITEAEMKKMQRSMWSALSSRTKVRIFNGHYEIMCNHYITFTQKCGEFMNRRNFGQTDPRNYLFLNTIIEHTLNNAPKPSANTNTYRDSDGVERSFSVTTDHPQHVMFDECVTNLVAAYRRHPYKRSLEDVNNDPSRWEFGVINHTIRMARSAITESLRVEGDDNEADSFIQMDENTYAWVIFEAVSRVTPHRDKHDEFRKEMPYLLSRVNSAFIDHIADLDPRIIER